jgi:L-iditol 2-dehydrogenase
MAAAGICGTDIEKLHGGYGPGGILGHEVSGTVVSTGRGVSELRPGDRVIVHHHVPCYQCNCCRRGDYTMCDLFKKTNLDPCGLAEYFRVPEPNVARGALVRMPGETGFEEGALVEPTACCIRAIEKAHINRDDEVLIIGLGPTGLTQIQLLRRVGVSAIIGVDILPHRLKMARELGVSDTIDPKTNSVPDTVLRSTHSGVDLAIVSTGNPSAIQTGLAAVRKGGKLLLFGAPPNGSTISLDVNALFSKQISLISSYSCVESDIHHTLQLLARREIDLKSMITDRFLIQDAPKALENARVSKTAVKTMVLARP